VRICRPLANAFSLADTDLLHSDIMLVSSINLSNLNVRVIIHHHIRYTNNTQFLRLTIILINCNIAINTDRGLWMVGNLFGTGTQSIGHVRGRIDD